MYGNLERDWEFPFCDALLGSFSVDVTSSNITCIEDQTYVKRSICLTQFSLWKATVFTNPTLKNVCWLSNRNKSAKGVESFRMNQIVWRIVVVNDDSGSWWSRIVFVLWSGGCFKGRFLYRHEPSHLILLHALLHRTKWCVYTICRMLYVRMWVRVSVVTRR